MRTAQNLLKSVDHYATYGSRHWRRHVAGCMYEAEGGDGRGRWKQQQKKKTILNAIKKMKIAVPVQNHIIKIVSKSTSAV